MKAKVWPDEGLAHVHLEKYSINIRQTSEGVIVDVWESGFEGAESLATCAVADSDWELDDER